MTETILPTIRSTHKLFIAGPFGSGKTTLAIERINWLLQRERTRGDDILVLVPQRTLGQPYYLALRRSGLPLGPPPRVATVAGLARASVELYWPLLINSAGLANPGREPTFLNLETSQYHMAQLVDAALDRGEFDGIRVERSRIISQVLDNLNKSALNGFTIDEAYARLELGVPLGEQRSARLNALRAARRISEAFRALCLEHTLIDYSLQIELFNRHILTNDWSRTHLFRSHKHLIFDNAEEDTHTAHELVEKWLPHLETALIATDLDAGYRVFLGADPQGVARLARLCDQKLTIHHNFVMNPPLAQLAQRVNQAILGPRAHQNTEAPQSKPAADMSRDPVLLLPDVGFRFYPQMIAWVVDQVRRLVRDEGVAPRQIAILAPFVSDALRFSLQTGLAKHDIVSTTHRPAAPYRMNRRRVV